MTQNLSERDILLYLRDKHNANFNQYQKTFLEKKIKCYTKDMLPSQYYACIGKLDEKMIANSDYLKSKFGELEIELESRNSRCVEGHKNMLEKVEPCKQKELQWYRDAADQVYTSFYGKQSK